MFSTGESPYGIPYVQWTEKWWQWVANFTKATDPNDSYTSEKCSINQNISGNVWFLSMPPPEMSAYERTCKIPRHMSILLPANTGECDTGDSSSPITCAKQGDEGARITVYLDGAKYDYDVVKDRITSNLFSLTWTDNNIFDAPAGTVKGAVDGYFIFLKPMTPGNHTLSYDADVLPPNNPNMGYHQQGIYHLEIE